MSKKIVIFFFIISLLASTSLFSQEEEFCNEITDKKILNDYNKSLKLLDEKKYTEADKILQQIVVEEEDFAEAWAILAELQYIKYENATDEKRREQSLNNYKVLLEKIISVCPAFQNYQINFILGKLYFMDNNLEKSKKYFSTFVSKQNSGELYAEANEKLAYIEKHNELISKSVPYNPVLIKNISSQNDEYLPFISPDETLMFFTRAYMKNDITSSYGEKYVEEFSISYKDAKEENSFNNIKAMPFPFNRGRNQGAASININNSELFITICEMSSREYFNCDIYSSTRKQDSWTELKNLGSNINGANTWESQPSISGDGKTLYFASLRPENIEFDPNNPTSDIYYSTRNPDGSWSKAKNMGQVINSPGNEKSPYIHSDSKTLYFSSDGHNGIGGYDIFFSKDRDDKWEIPKNIGYPINTDKDDLGFIVNTPGTKAYFASNKLKGVGGWDIYSLDLYDEIKPEKVILIKGNIIDENGYNLTDAKLDLINVENNVVTPGQVNEYSGEYAITVPVTSDTDEYLMVVKKQDYSFSSQLIEVNENKVNETQNVDFEMKTIEEGASIKLNDIYFQTASYEINKKSFVVLNNFIVFLEENPSIKIEIRGHTDNIGTLESNMILSKERAKSVYKYLIDRGIPESRLQYNGYGPNLPIDSNDTEAGRAKNRRTEFQIIEK